MPYFRADATRLDTVAQDMQGQTDSLRDQVASAYQQLGNFDRTLSTLIDNTANDDTGQSSVLNDFLYDMANYLAQLIALREALGKIPAQMARNVTIAEQKLTMR